VRTTSDVQALQALENGKEKEKEKAQPPIKFEVEEGLATQLELAAEILKMGTSSARALKKIEYFSERRVAAFRKHHSQATSKSEHQRYCTLCLYTGRGKERPHKTRYYCGKCGVGLCLKKRLGRQKSCAEIWHTVSDLTTVPKQTPKRTRPDSDEKKELSESMRKKAAKVWCVCVCLCVDVCVWCVYICVLTEASVCGIFSQSCVCVCIYVYMCVCVCVYVCVCVCKTQTTSKAFQFVPANRLLHFLEPTVWHEFTPLAAKHKAVNLGL